MLPTEKQPATDGPLTLYFLLGMTCPKGEGQGEGQTEAYIRLCVGFTLSTISGCVPCKTRSSQRSHAKLFKISTIRIGIIFYVGLKIFNFLARASNEI